MPINVSEAIDSDTAESVQIIRESSGGYVDGIWEDGSEQYIKALASVQAPTPAQLRTLTEAERTADVKMFICNKRLYTKTRKGLSADKILWKGYRYKLIDNADWSSYGHNVAMGAKLNG